MAEFTVFICRKRPKIRISATPYPIELKIDAAVENASAHPGYPLGVNKLPVSKDIRVKQLLKFAILFYANRKWCKTFSTRLLETVHLATTCRNFGRLR